MIEGITIAAMAKLIFMLLAVMNPFGNAAIYVGIVNRATAKEKHKMALMMSIAVFVILMVSVWFGNIILNFFGISIGAFTLAGSVILILIGLRLLGMIASKSETKEVATNKISLAIVPLAIPIVAGPATIAAIIAHVHKDFHAIEQKLVISMLVIVVVFIIWLFFRLVPTISRIIGKNAMDIVEKIMGLILVAIAFQMMVEGITEAFLR